MTPKDVVRVTPLAHAATPLGMGYGETRFASPTQAFKVLYLGENLVTSLAEAVVRDRFQGKVGRVLDVAEVDKWAAVNVTATAPLALVDLRTTGALRLGVSTEAVKGKVQNQGRKLSQAVHDATDFDGFLYASRLTGAKCVCVFERAVRPLTATAVVPLVRHPGLLAALKALDVELEKP
ncbi:RES family NAD+ phosphorylase (plasmid) [Brevundimonas staleyi]|uniref:RES family NAD+ phosphorylase n=1 Tax=Brevundimonas staleyi TaxID=74326 RepID=A0ABW0FNX8_9CAUL